MSQASYKIFYFIISTVLIDKNIFSKNSQLLLSWNIELKFQCIELNFLKKKKSFLETVFCEDSKTLSMYSSHRKCRRILHLL